jgi:hypothetical protein
MICAKISILGIFLISSLFCSPSAFASENFGDGAEVQAPQFDRSGVTTRANQRKPGKNSDQESTSHPAQPVVEFIPACQIANQSGTGPIDRTPCENQACEGDGYLYAKTITKNPDQPPDVSLVCQHDGPNIRALAIDEFYTNKIAVPAPTVSPEKATFANFPNIFSTPIREQVQNTGITVAKVKIKFVPAFYRWEFGDDTKLDTTDPGKPYDPNLANRVDDVEKNFPVTHRFDTTGQFDIRLTVTFHGAYSINGGPWQTIPGSTAATSPPHTLTVKQARGQFVSENGE